MAAPNMNGRLHLTDVHQNSPASLGKGPYLISKIDSAFLDDICLCFYIPNNTKFGTDDLK